MAVVYRDKAGVAQMTSVSYDNGGSRGHNKGFLTQRHSRL